MSSERRRLTETSYGGVVVRGGDVLVITPAGKRVTALPKGGAERGERPEESAVREVREETGVAARVRECTRRCGSSCATTCRDRPTTTTTRSTTRAGCR